MIPNVGAASISYFDNTANVSWISWMGGTKLLGYRYCYLNKKKIMYKTVYVLFQVQYKDAAQQKDNDQLMIGSAAADMIEQAERHHLRPSRIQHFYSAVRMYFQDVSTYLLQKLPLRDEVLRHAEVANPAKKLTAEPGSLVFFMKRYPVLIPIGESRDTILEQFARYQVSDITSCLAERVDVTWSNIARALDLTGLGKVMAGILTIPHSSASCERVFSVVRKNSTDQRGRLNEDTMEALLVVKPKVGHYLDDSRQFSHTQLKQLKSSYYLSLKKQ